MPRSFFSQLEGGSVHPWTNAPSARERGVVERNVCALLDAIAPEEKLTRGERLRQPIERHRTPTGCVLQAASAALSLSWFADSSTDASFGELHILVWRGVVTRRGSSPNHKGAHVRSTLILRPAESDVVGGAWRDAKGTDYGTQELAEHCLSLLDAELAEGY